MLQLCPSVLKLTASNWAKISKPRDQNTETILIEFSHHKFYLLQHFTHRDIFKWLHSITPIYPSLNERYRKVDQTLCVRAHTEV